jgi:hypothetical protein
MWFRTPAGRGEPPVLASSSVRQISFTRLTRSICVAGRHSWISTSCLMVLVGLRLGGAHVVGGDLQSLQAVLLLARQHQALAHGRSTICQASSHSPQRTARPYSPAHVDLGFGSSNCRPRAAERAAGSAAGTGVGHGAHYARFSAKRAARVQPGAAWRRALPRASPLARGPRSARQRKRRAPVLVLGQARDLRRGPNTAATGSGSGCRRRKESATLAGLGGAQHQPAPGRDVITLGEAAAEGRSPCR